MIEPLEITVPLKASIDLKFCEQLVAQINKDPNRRAEIKREGLFCQVVDYSKPVRNIGYKQKFGHGTIIGWEPVEEEES